MTLNCYKFSFFRNFALFWEGAAKRIKIDPHCQRRNPFALKALFNNAHRVQLKMQLKPNGPTPRSQAVITRRYAWKFLRQILHACLAWFRPLMCCFCMKLFYAYEMVEQPSSAMLHGYSRPRRIIGFFWAPEFLGCSRFTRSPMLGLARARTPLFFYEIIQTVAAILSGVSWGIDPVTFSQWGPNRHGSPLFTAVLLYMACNPLLLNLLSYFCPSRIVISFSVMC